MRNRGLPMHPLTNGTAHGPREGISRRRVLKAGGAAVAAALAGWPGFRPYAEQLPAGQSVLRSALQPHVERRYVPGLVAAVLRGDDLQVVPLGSQAYGGVPMRADSIFRIASIGKPLTAAAAMILVEEGVLGLDDPVGEFLPELAAPRVLRSIDSELDDTVAARRAISLRDLLTLRFGLGAIMVFPPEYPIQRAMEEAGVAPGPWLFKGTPDEYMQQLGALPLVAHPGEAWLYHNGLDVAGILVARASGQSLGEFMAERIFDPLGMPDTGFYVPETKRHRFVTAYWRNFETGEVEIFDGPEGDFSEPPAFEAGGGGHVSTAVDYLRFCRMLMNKGELEGRRILKPASVDEMMKDQLTAAQRNGPGVDVFFNGHSSWGLGAAVALRQKEPWLTPGRYGWDGGYGTSAYTDPARGIAGVLMTQRVLESPAPPQVYRDFWKAVYAAG